MSTYHDSRYACHPDDFKSYDTSRIRNDFLIEKVFEKDTIQLCYIHYDRYIAGGAFPIETSLSLSTIDPLKAAFFLERRELGIINVGQAGIVTVGKEEFQLENKEALYVGRGNQEVTFSSIDPSNPAKFYLNSAPAHKTYPCVKISREDAEVVQAGDSNSSNARTIRKMIVASNLNLCQLQMGMTELETGNVWNTMPCHTHDRRMEVYFYFDMNEGDAVCHFMGQPQETRHVWMSNEQAIISPPWSIHSGSGTSRYTFIWGMAGENLDYGDMDMCSISELR